MKLGCPGLCCAHCSAAGGGHYWGRVALRRCSSCHAAYYCGRDCQRAHFDAHKRDCARGKRARDAEIARVAARRLDGIVPAKGDRPALRARHARDGYGFSALLLYEKDDPDAFYCAATVPTHDDRQRGLLPTAVARFDAKHCKDLLRDLVDLKLVTPVDPGDQDLDDGQALGRIEIRLPDAPPPLDKDDDDLAKRLDAMLDKNRKPPTLDDATPP